MPTTPAGTTTYVTTLNGAIQGGITASGATTQAVSFQKVGQVFNSSGGTLNQLSFVDTNGAAGGEELRIALFDPTTFGIVGPTLYSSSVAALTGYGDKGGAGGADALAYHTWSNINLLLAPGAQYYAYVVPTAGSNVFNGSNSRYQSGAYFFELATAPSALGGEMVFQFNNGEYRQVAGSPGAGPLQALYNISITPSATAVVPEPASRAMMIGGFGFIGGALRRRNVRTSVKLV